MCVILRNKINIIIKFKKTLTWGSIILIFILINLISNVLISNSKVISASMEPTINIGDNIIGYNFAYNNTKPKRGDIIIFHHPDDYSLLYIKRIIGLPGDTILIEKGKIYVNDMLLLEEYIKETMIIEERKIFHVPENSFFVLGDNRNFSEDSRHWNNSYVLSEHIIAKAFLRIFPGIKILK